MFVATTAPNVLCLLVKHPLPCTETCGSTLWHQKANSSQAHVRNIHITTLQFFDGCVCRDSPQACMGMQQTPLLFPNLKSAWGQDVGLVIPDNNSLFSSLWLRTFLLDQEESFIQLHEGELCLGRHMYLGAGFVHCLWKCQDA